MAIWGSKATQFSLPEDPNMEDRPIIVLFTGCLVKYFQGISFTNPTIFNKLICQHNICITK